MIGNLRLTTEQNTEQDWLKTNLARFTGMMQGQRDLATVGQMLLSELTLLVNAHQGVMYRVERASEPTLVLVASFADRGHDGYGHSIRIGEGLIGQCVIERRIIFINEPLPGTTPIRSGIFKAIPLNSIEATMQTENLLKQSQQLATELQTQQGELQQTNEQLAQKAHELALQNAEVERKNQEIEQARRALEEKASELA